MPARAARGPTSGSSIGVVFRSLRQPIPVMRSYLAVRPDPPRAELRALIEASRVVD